MVFLYLISKITAIKHLGMHTQSFDTDLSPNINRLFFLDKTSNPYIKYLQYFFGAHSDYLATRRFDQRQMTLRRKPALGYP